MLLLLLNARTGLKVIFFITIITANSHCARQPLNKDSLYWQTGHNLASSGLQINMDLGRCQLIVPWSKKKWGKIIWQSGLLLFRTISSEKFWLRYDPFHFLIFTWNSLGICLKGWQHIDSMQLQLFFPSLNTRGVESFEGAFALMKFSPRTSSKQNSKVKLPSTCRQRNNCVTLPFGSVNSELAPFYLSWTASQSTLVLP